MARVLIIGDVHAELGQAARMAQASGNYIVRYRIDRPFRQLILTWSELTGYSRESGRFQETRAIGRTQIPNPRQPGQPTQLTARSKLEPLKPGAYRIQLAGELAPGQTTQIYERTYWFDGKTFEEL